jgi:hypothetical protein
MTDDDLNLANAIDAVQSAHGKLRALTAAHPGDSLYFESENRLAALSLGLIGRQNHTRTQPPMSPADLDFYS